MAEILLAMAFAFLGGIITGSFYFGTLWLTVKQVTKIGKPYGLLIISFLLRGTVILAVFYVIFRENVLNIAPCLIGFFLVRLIATNLVVKSIDDHSLPKG